MTKKKNPEDYKKVGRPNKIKEEELRKFETAFKIGCNNSEACAYADIPESTFYDYIKANPEFSVKIDKWKKNPILKAKHTIYQNLEDTKTAKWYLERKCKDEFSTKQEVEVSSSELVKQGLNKINEYFTDNKG